MFTRYANVESAILDIKGASTRQTTASLDKISDFENYRTDQGYMYVRLRAISSRTNKNHDGWPSIELAGSPEIFQRHHGAGGFTVEAADGNQEYGFATFVGKPVFVDHHNSNPKKARGVIVDAKLRVLDQKTAAKDDDYWSSSDVDPEHLPPTEVELLLEVDAKTYPKFAKAILSGDLDGFSMGANVGYTKCSHCANVAHEPDEFCSHVLMKGATHDLKTADGKRISKKSYENCYECGFFEISGVFEPADPTALAREVRAAVLHEGDVLGPMPGGPGPEGAMQLRADPVRPHELEVETYAEELIKRYPGMDPDTALGLAQEKVDAQFGKPPGHGEGANLETEEVGGVQMPRPRQYVESPVDLPTERLNDPRWSKTAQNPLPQSFMTRAPDEVDTLRKDQICPISGDEMEDGVCPVCGYVAPPPEFDNPDLQEAQKVRDEMKQQDEQAATPAAPNQPGEGDTPPNPLAQPGGPLSGRPTKPQVAASVTGEMRWTPKVHPKTAARINQVETPVSSTNKPTSNEPSSETVTSDQTQPVTAAMLTAKKLIADAQRNHQGDTMSTRTADGATPASPDAAADKRVDVEGVGGVDQASNEEASKAETQTDVTGIGGTGVEGVEADKTESLPTADRQGDDSGFNTDKTTDGSGPTSTYPDSDGSHEGVTDPVTSEPFPASEDGVKASQQHRAYEDGTLEEQEQQGDPIAGGGTAVKGVSPADPVGNAEKRVNVLEHTTTPANNSGPTTTWSGTDGNKVLRQQDPTTGDTQEWAGGPVDAGGVKARLLNAMRLAEVEQELGLLTREAKFDRIAELETKDPVAVRERIETLAQVKTAGMARLAQTKQARRVPPAFGRNTAAPHGFDRIASDTVPEPTPVSDEAMDAAVFVR